MGRERVPARERLADLRWNHPATPRPLRGGRGRARDDVGRRTGRAPERSDGVERLSLPFGGTLVETNDDTEVPYSRLVYESGVFADTTEITGEPVATIWVSSANADSPGAGTAQLNVGLSELFPDGSAHEFSHARIGLSGLGSTPVPVVARLSVASHRIDAGNELMLVIASSDATETLPAPGVDPFYVHHDAGAPSSITLPIVPVDRTPPAGDPPSGTAYTDDPLGAICTVLGLPC
ncbi:MAG: CocE/NonD family hydrolase C-terminal non-catalytic domain-containing protein [Candidatus Binatia bacterium]